MGWCISVLVALVCYIQINNYLTQAYVVNQDHTRMHFRIPLHKLFQDYTESKSYSPDHLRPLASQNKNCVNNKCSRKRPPPKAISISLPSHPKSTNIFIDTTGKAKLCSNLEPEKNISLDITMDVKQNNVDNGAKNNNNSVYTQINSELVQDSNGNINALSVSNSSSGSINNNLTVVVVVKEESNKPAVNTIQSKSSIQDETGMSAGAETVNQSPSESSSSTSSGNADSPTPDSGASEKPSVDSGVASGIISEKGEGASGASISTGNSDTGTSAETTEADSKKTGTATSIDDTTAPGAANNAGDSNATGVAETTGDKTAAETATNAGDSNATGVAETTGDKTAAETATNAGDSSATGVAKTTGDTTAAGATIKAGDAKASGVAKTTGDTPAPAPTDDAKGAEP